MTDTILYLCLARLDGVDRIFAWASGDDSPDEIVVDDAGNICTFESQQDARAAFQLKGRIVSPNEPVSYDFDSIVEWCKSTAPVSDCEQLLNVWNMLTDLPGETSLFRAADMRAKNLYDKLFWATNPPALTPPGEQFIPTWNASEADDIKRLLLLGIAEFRGRVAPASPRQTS